jgi:hypothetical protein
MPLGGKEEAQAVTRIGCAFGGGSSGAGAFEMMLKGEPIEVGLNLYFMPILCIPPTGPNIGSGSVSGLARDSGTLGAPSGDVSLD